MDGAGSGYATPRNVRPLAAVVVEVSRCFQHTLTLRLWCRRDCLPR